MSYLQAAFDKICEENQKPDAWFVVLVSSQQRYGGPEEGGWWYSVNQLEAWKEYPSEELAEEAKEKVERLAEEMNNQAQAEYGKHCQESMDWLEDRGLEADYLPEPDGPENYSVMVCDRLPTFNNSRPQYC